MNGLPPFDADAVRALVEEVVRRIRAEATPAAPAARAAGERPRDAMLPDRVVTLSSIERLPAGTRRVAIADRAVVTPSAADRARERGIEIDRDAGAADGHPPPPFFVVEAACRGKAPTPSAAIARMVPGTRRLPAAGLAESIAALAEHASRDAARGILLTGSPAVAVVLANRSRSLRAVTGPDVPALAAAAAATAANLLVVDPAAFTAGLVRFCAGFASRPAAPLPPELAAAVPDCGCTTRHP